jgi:predicted Zn-dependent protease
MAAFRADSSTPVHRKRLFLLCLLAAAGLAILVWQRRPPTPRARREARIAAADRLTQTGSTAAAIDDLRSLIVADPSSAVAYSSLGSAYLAEGSYDLAVQPLEMAVSLSPMLPHLQCRLADAYLHIRDRDAAVRSIQTALKQEPDCARAHLVAAEQWLRDDDLTHALADFREAARLAPGSPLAFQRAGYILLELDRPAEAEKLLLDGLRADPNDVGLHVQLGRLYALRNSDPASLARAREHYLRAIPGNPNATTVKASLGEVALQAGKPDEARVWWEQALRENRNETKALYGLAQLQLSSGKKKEGQELLQRYAATQKFQREVTALRMQTATRPTRALRLKFARLSLDAGLVDAAERQLTALLREYPDDPVVRNLQGDLYMVQQRARDAEREYRLASALPPEPTR